MKRRFAAISLIALGLAMTACESGGDGNIPAPGGSDEPATIAEAAVDADGDGTEETLVVRMVSGRLKEDAEPGPYTGPYWEGEFALELHSGGGELLHELALNETFGGEAMRFEKNREFEIVFADYNNDGFPDFSIGQYLSSNGSLYNLYSIMPDGIRVLHGNLFTASRSYSHLYKKAGNTSFLNRYYDMENGTYAEVLYTWQGDRFVRTECEGCGAEAGAGDPQVRDDGGVSWTVRQTKEGFVLLPSATEGFYVSQTWVSPSIDGETRVVHIVNTYEDRPGQSRIGRDAVVVRPDTAEVRVYPLFRTVVDDRYGPDSVAKAYGFADDRHLVYVSAAADPDRPSGYFYRVEQMDITTGETEILVPEIPGIDTDDHFAPGWLNEDGGTLVLNSYRGGSLWTIDLDGGGSVRTETGFSHEWPFYLTAAAPDGEKFWYSDYAAGVYRLHDNTGALLEKAPVGDGYDAYPAFRWSPDGRYAAVQDTFGQNDSQMIDDNGEMYVIAPQRIRFFDAGGRLVRTVETNREPGKAVELAGWVDGAEGAALLHEYVLEKAPGQAAAKAGSTYRWADLRSGNDLSLALEPDFTELEQPAPVRPAARFSPEAGKIYAVDRQLARISVLAESGILLSEPGEDRIRWLAFDPDTAASAVHAYDPKTGRHYVQSLDGFAGENLREIRLAGGHWLVAGMDGEKILYVFCNIS